MRLVLELIRIIFIMLIGGVILGAIARSVYKAFDVSVGADSGGWLSGIAILLLLFVWYRNRLQFTGFFSSSTTKKLPKAVTGLLVLVSMILFIVPIFLQI